MIKKVTSLSELFSTALVLAFHYSTYSFRFFMLVSQYFVMGSIWYMLAFADAVESLQILQAIFFRHNFWSLVMATFFLLLTSLIYLLIQRRFIRSVVSMRDRRHLLCKLLWRIWIRILKFLKIIKNITGESIGQTHKCGLLLGYILLRRWIVNGLGLASCIALKLNGLVIILDLG